MRKRALPFAVLLGVLMFCGSKYATAQTNTAPKVIIENLSPESEIENFQEEGIWVGRNGVIVKFGSTELTANQIAFSQRTGDVIADGAVRLRSEDQYFVTEHLEYNFRTKAMKSEKYRAGFAPFYASGLSLESSGDRSYVSTNAFLTTDDVQTPNYRIKGEKVTIIPGESIHAKNATLYVGGVPSMFLPVYTRDLTKHRNYWTFVPGYRSKFGPYLRSSYHFGITDHVYGAVDVDAFQKRGFGYGPEFGYDFGPLGKGEARFWRIDDQTPGADPFTNKAIPRDRERVSFWHQTTLQTNLTAKVVVEQESDPRVRSDFFESEYRRNSQPRSFLEVNQLWRNWTLDVLAQAQVNEFLQTVERLPDVKLSAIRQEIGQSPLYYEGENSLAYLRYQSGLPSGTNYSAIRADTYHQVVLPQTFFGWLNLTPRVGGRFTHYGETEGLTTNFDEKDRAVFNTGAETSFKASRVWRGAENKFFEVDGLRHIIEPSFNYVFVPRPNVTPMELPQFDTEIPTLRLLPIDYPDYNAIDAIDSQNVVRLGLRNKLQTKREDGVQNIVNWNLMTDWRLNPRAGQSTFADVYSDMDLRPWTWLTMNSETRFNSQNHYWVGANHSVTFTPVNYWSWKLGHRYFRGDPLLGPDSDNNVIYSSMYYRFNENWGARATQHFEARDGTMEEQYYTLYRDFRSWTGALTLRFRDNRVGPSEFAVAFTFSFKAFPRFTLGADRDYPDFLLGS